MPGVVFLVCVPTKSYEREVLAATNAIGDVTAVSTTAAGRVAENNLNINLPENDNAILRLEVELRNKHIPMPRQRARLKPAPLSAIATKKEANNVHVPMEQILDELLKKLEIENVVWSTDKTQSTYQVVFPLDSGDPCETTLHCLTELGFGKKFNSTVSVLPCSVSYDALKDKSGEIEQCEPEQATKWDNFVDSIRSKLTVKQVVDGVRAGGSLSFDYLLLIVTADSLAALGLVENNAPNIVAAMLVSPLMGPVMSITFGAIISDRDLMKVGFISLGLGIFISIVFGFIFGLILGTTEQPWGFGDWPTEEMKGRGNARSLWMGVLWALTSGTGVAVALLQGSAGPLIGVAISASLLPPVVNCGLFWALACIWLIYDDAKIPHLKGEPFVTGARGLNRSAATGYVPVYTDYLPTEFLINGIVSALLTVVNVICIFITAIIVLKIKEVAAPYTSSPDLRRFWETDIRTVRRTNRSTMRRRPGDASDKASRYNDVNDPKNQNLELALQQALKEAINDDTFRKVKRMSYSSNAAPDELVQHLPAATTAALSTNSMSMTNKQRTDLTALGKMVSTLLDAQQNNSYRGSGSGGSSATGTSSATPTPSKLSRFGSLAKSWRRSRAASSSGLRADDGPLQAALGHAMPTIAEAGGIPLRRGIQSPRDSCSADVTISATSAITDADTDTNNHRNSCQDNTIVTMPAANVTGVRRILNSIANAPQRFSHHQQNSDETKNLTENILN